MLNPYPNPSKNFDYTIMALQMKNQELTHDNLMLTNQIYKLRQILSYYQQKFIEFRKAQDYHHQQVEEINKNTKQILQKIDRSQDRTSTQIKSKIKQLKKQVFYKKMEQLQVKYQKRNQQYEQLLQFKNKIHRLRNTWDIKSKDKADSNSLQSLFVWLYNQIVKARSFNQSKPRKKQISVSKFKNKQNDFSNTNQSGNKIGESKDLSSDKSKRVIKNTKKDIKEENSDS